MVKARLGEFFQSQVKTPSASSGPDDAQELGAEIAAKDLVLDITADKDRADRGTQRCPLPLQSSCPLLLAEGGGNHCCCSCYQA